MKNNPKKLSLIQSFKSASVICVGDIILDRFIDGEVDRISPEAPIPVLKVKNEETMLGGAGNVVRNLITLGAKVRFLSVIGNDDAGYKIQEMIKKESKVNVNLIVETARQTSIKTRFLSGNQQILRVDRETLASIKATSSNKLYRLIAKDLPSYGALVLSDYGKGVLGKELVQKLINAARARKIPIIVDPKGTDFSRYKGATLITPNRKELEQATGLPSENDKNIKVASEKLMKSCQIDSVLVTRSSDGMTLTDRLKTSHFSAEAREVFDVSGAGDTVAAVMACALSKNLSLTDGTKIANAAAGVVVGKFGTASVSAIEVARALDTRPNHDFQTKIKTEDQLKKILIKWKNKGFRVGFTNGCFDILHPGHLSLLQQAKAASDKLVVAVNTDLSIKRLKGEDRPLISETARAEILAALSSVDIVVLFDDQTPLRIIKKIKPDVLIKGADYKLKNVVGNEFVSKNGGEIILAKIKKGFSSSGIIKKIKT